MAPHEAHQLLDQGDARGAATKKVRARERGHERVARLRDQLAGRAELAQFLDAKSLFEPVATPSPYAGIYRVEGQHKFGNKLEKVYLTTHLEEAEVKRLFDQRGLKVYLPGQGIRGQWVSIFSTVSVVGLVIGLMYFQTNLGRGRNLRISQRPNVTFREVAGIEEAKGEVQEIVDFLRDPKKFQRLGGNLPKGVLLIGPPGTGKTMLVRCVLELLRRTGRTV
jgi:cell division protease FtsH